MAIAVTHFSDPGCPWAYSASPAHAVLRWRFGDQLAWRLVTIGLTEQADQYIRRGYTPAGSARGYLRFRHRGMPFATQPRARVAATAFACRVIVATRLRAPEHEHAVFRALQFGWFTTPLVLDDADDVAQALARVDDLDVQEILAAVDDGGVERAYQADRAEARTAAASPAEAQGRTTQTDGDVRYTAPSLIFERDGQRLEAGGFQPVEAYDVLLANLDPTLERREPAKDPLDALCGFPYGLTTYEIAAIMTERNEAPDPEAAEAALIDRVAAGSVIREPLGDGALWLAGPHAPSRRSDPDEMAPGRARATRPSARSPGARR
jgi:2-hydroxychromene-2-carboxylate isomerase